MLRRLLLATNNKGKVSEYKSLLRVIPCDLFTPAELGIKVTADETGNTLEENARLKATAFASASQTVSLADDSGLEVDALGGRPGPLSARFAGEGATDRDRINYLLKQMEGVPPDQRTALFRCVIAVATPQGKVALCSGECHGVITLEPRGKNGFGYDPVFYLLELKKTMAELSLSEKNKISHRAEAARKVPAVLAKLGII